VRDANRRVNAIEDVDGARHLRRRAVDHPEAVVDVPVVEVW